LVDLVQKDMVDLNEFYNGQYFWRANNRTAPHNIITSSANLNKFLEKSKIIQGDYQPWLFKDDSPNESASTTAVVALNYNQPDFKASWIYNKEDNDYIRYLGDKPYLTADKNIISAKNIIIQYVPAKVVDDKLRLDMADIGSGKATICLDGICLPGNWSKENYTTRTMFTYANGDEVKFNAGTTWIEVVRP